MSRRKQAGRHPFCIYKKCGQHGCIDLRQKAAMLKFRGLDNHLGIRVASLSPFAKISAIKSVKMIYNLII